MPFHCCACEVTLIIVGHINRFFLLTYLLTLPNYMDHYPEGWMAELAILRFRDYSDD